MLHIKELTGLDWLGLAVCVAVLVLIWVASRPPWPPLTPAMDRTEKVLIWLLALALVAGAGMLLTAGGMRP